MAAHLEMTLRWARASSLTAIRSVDEAVRRHVIESVAAAGWVEPGLGSLLDIGSGNGYPAIPIKCLKPQIPVIMLEPALRKSVFLRQVISALALSGVGVRRDRVTRGDDLLRYAPIGTISMRAVAVVGALLEGAPAALVPGGRLVLFAGESTARDALSVLPSGLRVIEQAPLPGRRKAGLLVIQRA